MYLWAKQKGALERRGDQGRILMGSFVSSKFWRTEVRTMCVCVFTKKSKQNQQHKRIKLEGSGWCVALLVVSFG